MKSIVTVLALMLSVNVFSTTTKIINRNTMNEVNGLEIRFQPDSVVYVYENTGPEMSKQLYTAVLQNMAFVNVSDQAIVLKNGTIKALDDGVLLQTQLIKKQDILQSATKFSRYQEHGILELYDFQFQTSKYLKGIKLATNDTLKPNQGVIIAYQTFLFNELPNALEVIIQGTTLSGEQAEVSKKLKVVNYKSKNNYIFPLKGTWFVGAGPSLTGHHRWGAIQEFALDFIKIGDGMSTYKNSGESFTDFYAYGEPVYAIADGTVVSAFGEVEESSDVLKKADETEETYLERVKAHQEELMRRGFRYIYGNHVIIRHANNEYSVYFHLKRNGISVKTGDVIKQGEVIAKLGGSGNSTEPHLHFHVSDGSDIVYARSIPVEFDNITLWPTDNGNVRHLHSGQILKTKQ